MYASSTGRATFIGDDPFVNPLCVGFCILWITPQCGKLHKMDRKHFRLF
jgi:hypothetical protein